MEDRTISPQESLLIISRMMDRTRMRLERGMGRPSLIWGYTTVTISMAVYLLLPYWAEKANYLWLMLPIVGVPLTILFNRRETKTPIGTTGIDRFVHIVWLVIGFAAFVQGLCSAFIPLPVLQNIMLLMGVGSAITAFAFRLRILQVSSIFGIVASFPLFFLSQSRGLLYFAVLFFLTQCLPGHYFEYLVRKKGS